MALLGPKRVRTKWTNPYWLNPGDTYAYDGIEHVVASVERARNPGSANLALVDDRSMDHRRIHFVGGGEQLLPEYAKVTLVRKAKAPRSTPIRASVPERVRHGLRAHVSTAPVNRNGLTFTEWKRLAGKHRGKPVASRVATDAWEAGERPEGDEWGRFRLEYSLGSV